MAHFRSNGRRTLPQPVGVMEIGCWNLNIALRAALMLVCIAGVAGRALSQQPARPDRDTVRIACGADRKTFPDYA